MHEQRPIKELLRWLWLNTAGVKRYGLLSCTLGILRVGLGLLFIWLSKDLVDAAVGRASASTLLTMSIVLVVIMLAETGLLLAMNYINNKAEAKEKNNLRSRIFDHLMHTKWIEHQQWHSGDLLNRLTEDVRQIADVTCFRLPQTVVMVAQFVGAFAVLCVLSWTLALCVVFIMPFFVLISKFYVKRTRAYTASIRQMDSAIHTRLQESIQHQPMIQAMESEGEVVRNVDDMQADLYATTIRRSRFSVFSRGMVQGGFVTCYLVAFLWSVWSLHTGAITFGVMTAFLQLVSRLQFPVVNISQHIPAFVQALTSIDRLEDIEQLPHEDNVTPVMLDRPVGIRVENISYRYPTAKRDVFDDFSCDFAPGSKTVVMGETGVGKSTLVKLLLALLTPDKGEIVLYSGDIRGEDAPRSQSTPDGSTQAIANPATRCNFVYVPQGNSLLDGTIRDNLLVADPTATDERLREVLHIAVADFVESLPKGLDTRCGELGTSLSEGQAQRIAIARALLRRGSILLFDEFNSSLDMQTAATLMERIVNHCQDRTVIFISHRPEVETFCTQTLRLK